MSLFHSNQEINVTVERLLTEFRDGKLTDADLVAALNRDIRKLAQIKLKSERPNHTLQATEIANLVYLRIASSTHHAFEVRDASHLIHLLGKMIDNVLTDHARRRRALRRGGPDARPETIDEMLIARGQDTEQAVILRQARDQLEALHPRQAEVIRLRYIVGLSEDETASALGVSPETVKLDARKAKAFLQVKLLNQQEL